MVEGTEDTEMPYKFHDPESGLFLNESWINLQGHPGTIPSNKLTSLGSRDSGPIE